MDLPEWDELYQCGMCGADQLGAQLRPGYGETFECCECGAPAGVVRAEPVTYRAHILVAFRDFVRAAEGDELRAMCGDEHAGMLIADRAVQATDAYFSSREWRDRQDAQLGALLGRMGFGEA